MNKLEKGLWALLKDHFPREVHSQRVETGGVGTGVPDVNLCSKAGGEVWWELKMIRGHKVNLSPQQVAWIWKRHKCGGAVFIIARHRVEGVRLGNIDRLYIWSGDSAMEVATKGIKAVPLKVFDAPYDWKSIMNTILCLEE